MKCSSEKASSLRLVRHKEKLDCTALPERKAFDSILRKEACDAADYERAQQVWQEFKCKTFQDYMIIYLASMPKHLVLIRSIQCSLLAHCSISFHIKTSNVVQIHFTIADVLLLTDVFEEFREMCFITYELDPAFYITSPHLSFDVRLKCTGVELELISDQQCSRSSTKEFEVGSQ